MVSPFNSSEVEITPLNIAVSANKLETFAPLSFTG